MTGSKKKYRVGFHMMSPAELARIRALRIKSVKKRRAVGQDTREATFLRSIGEFTPMYQGVLSKEPNIPTHSLIVRLGHSWKVARLVLLKLGHTQRVAEYDAYVERMKERRKEQDMARRARAKKNT